MAVEFSPDVEDVIVLTNDGHEYTYNPDKVVSIGAFVEQNPHTGLTSIKPPQQSMFAKNFHKHLDCELTGRYGTVMLCTAKIRGDTKKCKVVDTRGSSDMCKYLRSKQSDEKLRGKPYMVLCDDESIKWDTYSSKVKAQMVANKMSKMPIKADYPQTTLF